MKNICLLIALFSLSACGAMGVGSNKYVTIHNNSDDTITATGEMGIIKIAPKTSATVGSEDDVVLNSSNKNCNAPIIQRTSNGSAIFLDIIPGALLGIIPIVVDGLTGNLYKLPTNYNYECQ